MNLIPEEISNRQRLDYLLDRLAEPFPEEAKEKSCSCGTGKAPSTTKKKLKTRREIIEETLLEALKLSIPHVKNVDTLDKGLDQLSEMEIGNLLCHVPTKIIDQHLMDLSLFLDPARTTTTLEEIKEWDRRHAKDFQKL